MTETATALAKVDRDRDKRRDAFLREIGAFRQAALELYHWAGRLEEIAASGQTSTRAILTEFRTQWEQRTGRPYVVTSEAKDMAIIKRLLKQLEAAELRDLIQRFFEVDNDWYQRQAWPLALFAKEINGLRVQRTGPDTASAALNDWLRA